MGDTITKAPEQSPRSPGSSSTCSSADSGSEPSPFFPTARSPGTSSRSSSVSVDDWEDGIEAPVLQRVTTADTWEDIQPPVLNRLTTLDRWEEQCDKWCALDSTAAKARAPEQPWCDGEASSNAWAINGANMDQPMPAGVAPVAFLVPVPVTSMLPVANVWAPSHQHEGPTGEGTAIPNAVAQPQALTLAQSNEGTLLVRWTVDARKLRSNDKQAVSPSFDISSFGNVPMASFKMIMYPKATIGVHGGACFKKAGGRGILQLKCESDLRDTHTNLTFRFAIGRGSARQGPCRSFTHDFAANAMAEACRSVMWNFEEVVNQESMTFDVELEISMNAA